MSARPKNRYQYILLPMTILAIIIVIRLFALTVVETKEWTSYAEDMSMRAVYETAPRGDILDRNGKIIATSRLVYSVSISRVALEREEAMISANSIMEILKSNDEDVSVTNEEVKKLLDDKSYTSYLPIVLAEDISSKSAELIEAGSIPGALISENYIRDYPEGTLASHVVGYLGKISEGEEERYIKNLGYRQDALIGKSGIEEKYEGTLKGTDAVSKFQVNSQGDVTALLEKSKPLKGKNIKLTLDIELQKATEDALEQAIKAAASGGVFQSRYGDRQMTYAKNAASGAAVAIDVETGQVLAMASYPDFNPNSFVEGLSSKEWEALQEENPNDPLSPAPLYNLATMSAIQPGSTFKPVTALAALNGGLDKNKLIYDKGYMMLGGRKYGCFLWNDTGSTHGYIALKDAIKVSCNYYFYSIAQEMGYEPIMKFADKLGLGEKTGIEIGESSGVLPSESLKRSGMKASLRNFLLAEEETYFKKSILKDRKIFSKKLENIINWADKDLTLEEIVGKLKKEDCIKADKIIDLAEVCKYSYLSQMEWTLGDTYNVSIGQGDNAYTVVQMANYMATLGNRGIKNRVSLVYDGGTKEASSGAKTVLDAEDVDTVIESMEAVTSENGGSLQGLFQGFPYSVAAKTGTAQRAGKINTEDEKEYLRRHIHLIAPGVSLADVETEAARLMEEYPDVYDSEVSALRRGVVNLAEGDITSDDIDRYKESYDNFAWTVALAPADDPKIAVAVMLVQGKTSSNAAPVAREIIGKYGEISRWEKFF